MTYILFRDCWPASLSYYTFAWPEGPSKLAKSG